MQRQAQKKTETKAFLATHCYACGAVIRQEGKERNKKTWSLFRARLCVVPGVRVSI